MADFVASDFLIKKAFIMCSFRLSTFSLEHSEDTCFVLQWESWQPNTAHYKCLFNKKITRYKMQNRKH